MSFSVKGTLVGSEPRLPFKADPPEWMEDAECSRANPELFHKPPGRMPGRGGDVGDTVEQARIAAAKGFCGDCLVRQQCLRWAIESDDTWAILGGLTPDERRRMKRRNSGAA